MASPLIIAAQPTLDRTVVVDQFKTGFAYRIPSVAVLPSGKALNVARSLHYLGCSVNVIALLGGYTGKWMFSELTRIGINIHPTWVNWENRIAYSIYDPTRGELTELIENTDGPMTEENWNSLLEAIKKILPASSSLILSGRAPHGFPDFGYKSLIEMAKRFSLPVFIDSYGVLLHHAIRSEPTVVKINQKEAGELFGQKLSTMQDCANCAFKLRSLGVEIAIITMGNQGALAVDRDGTWLAVPPVMQGVAIGSGDVLMAGFLYGITQKWPTNKALAYGVAAGSANLMIPGAGLFKSNDLIELLDRINILQM